MLTNILGGLEEGSNQRKVVYDDNGTCPTLQAAMGNGGGNVPLVVAIDEQNMKTKTDVFGTLTTDGSSPKHNNRVCEICAMRGRDPQNPSDRTAGNPNLEQRLEPNSEGICNTITTVQKDNMVLEMGYIEKGTGKHQSNVVYSEDGICPTICASYGVKQPPAMHVEANKLGNAANSNQRCVVYDENGNICPTVTTENIPSVLEDWTWEIDGVTYLIRIRKLTPRECWRLMDFNHGSFDKASEVNSNTQLYKQAGNSIVVNILTAVFGQLLEGKEDVYKNVNAWSDDAMNPPEVENEDRNG